MQETKTDQEWMDQVLDDIDKNQASRGGAIRFANPPKNAGERLVFRVLPGVPEMGSRFAKLVYKHFNISDKPEPCLRTWKRECPRCAVIAKYAGQAEFIKKYESQGKANMNVQIVGSGEYDPKLAYVLGMSDFFLSWLIKIIRDPLIGNENLIDPMLGRDMAVWRKRDKGAFEKVVSGNIRAIGRTPEEVKAILATRYNLDQIYKISATDEELADAKASAAGLERHILDRIGKGGGSAPYVPDQSGPGQQDPFAGAYPAGVTGPSESAGNAASGASPHMADGTKEFEHLKKSSGMICFGTFDQARQECVFCSHDIDCLRFSGKTSAPAAATSAQRPKQSGIFPDDSDVPF